MSLKEYKIQDGYFILYHGIKATQNKMFIVHVSSNFLDGQLNKNVLLFY